LIGEGECAWHSSAGMTIVEAESGAALPAVYVLTGLGSSAAQQINKTK
jgi:hypothetical protein